MEVRVQPEVLRDNALACRDLSVALSNGRADAEPETVLADKALPNWHTQKALQDLVWAWRDDLAKLGQRMQATADGLDACAHDYTHTDQAAAEHFKQAARQTW